MSMHHEAIRRVACGVALAAALLLTAAGRPARAADILFLDNQVVHVDQDQVAVRSGIEIRGGQQKWFRVYYQVLLDETTPLKLANGKAFVAYWGDLFPPAGPDEAIYSDIRMPLPLKEIQSAANLPKGERTLLWVVCQVWDAAQGKYLGSGWPARTPLLVTTTDTGRIAKVETFNTDPFMPGANDPQVKIKVRKCNLQTRHLKLRPGTELYKATYATGANRTHGELLLVSGDAQADLFSLNRGYFLERIDTQKRALEFALLHWGNSVLIKTPEQYQAIAQALKAKGWPAKHLNADPQFIGTGVVELPGLGYRVQATLILYDPAAQLLRNVVMFEYNVGYDGRFGEKVTELITVAQAPSGASTSQPSEGTFPLDPKAYDDLVRGLLTDIGSQRLPEFLSVTDEIATIPAPKGCDAKEYADPTQIKP